MRSIPRLKLLALVSTAAVALTLLAPVTPALTQDAPQENPPKNAKRGPTTPALPKTAAERDRALQSLPPTRFTACTRKL